MDSKFILPSPKFNKNSTEPSKTNLHYLTPCGMTLLPRARQPPPMYGARGSTVPAKYIKQEQQDYSNTPLLRPEYCDNCRMTLATAHDMRRHLDQHELCPAEDCSFAASASILERHIETNHITGLYKTVRKVWTPAEIATWRADRCKRFPTAANVETAKHARDQRLKRGERLEVSKLRFGRPEDRRRTRPQNNTKERTKKTKRQRHDGNIAKGEKEPKSIRTKPENSRQPHLKDAINLTSKSLPMFRGTSEMTEYEHVKAKLIAKNNALSNMLGMYGSDSEDESTDSNNTEVVALPLAFVEPDEEARKNPMNLKTGVLKLSLPVDTDLNQLPKSVSGSSDEGPDDLPIEDSNQLPKDVSGSSDKGPDELKIEDSNQLPKAVLGTSDEEPDELPIERKTEDPVPIESEEYKSPAVTDKTKRNVEAADRSSLPQKRHSGLNYKRARQVSKQNTMLSKLLASDIRHERNVLLQCVRYVCEQNFFNTEYSTTLSMKSTLGK